MVYLFCNVGWMEYYGSENNDDNIVGGGAHVDREGHGFEVCNFAPYKNQIYGYVQPPGSKRPNIKSDADAGMKSSIPEKFERVKINIDRLGADSNDDFIQNINVIWTAKHPGGGTCIIGWYINAIVYREYQKFDQAPPCQKANNVDGYRIVAEESNCTLLPTRQRTFQIPRGGIGEMRANIWYADNTSRGKEILKDVLDKYPSLLHDVPVYPDEIDPQEPLVEGARRRVTVNAYERNLQARQICLNTHGYRCSVCEMSFEEYYGDIGRGFIHVHHIKELSSIRGEYEIDPVKDLRPVCPNCHAMLHKKKRAFSVDELRQRLKKQNEG